MKHLKISLQVVVAMLAISATLAAKTGAIKSPVLSTAQSCYYSPNTPTVGTCVIPSGLMSTDDCTEPELVYCCYTFAVCIHDPTKALVSEIVLYRGA